MRPWLPLLLALAGCVWLMDEPSRIDAEKCADCAEDEACDEGTCSSRCWEDTGGSSLYAPCVGEDRVCLYGDCEIACVDEDCPGGFACDQFNECATYCFDSTDCRAGFACCESSGDGCDFASCFRR